MNKVKIAIIGVTGYGGMAALERMVKHPHVEIKYLCSRAQTGQSVTGYNAKLLPYKQQLPELFSHPDEIDFSSIDCLFTATPNGYASTIAEKVLNSNTRLIDLSADFRLLDSNIFSEYYEGIEYPSSLMSDVAYGLSEYNREQIKTAKIIANPGCYPTASSLALIPLVQKNIISTDNLIIDAKSGVTGAGKKANESLLFAELQNSFSAYKVLAHRHTPEIEQNLQVYGELNNSVKVKFTPHLLPISQGILTTIYGQGQAENITDQLLYETLQEYYASEPFVHVCEQSPKTLDVFDTNNCYIYATYDKHTNNIIIVSVIDNLIKGAAGQAIQNFNIMYGFDEKLGL